MASFIISPILGWIYVQSKMKNMEKGIHDDLARIKSKGKTLADIPKKRDWCFDELFAHIFLISFSYL